MRMSHLQSDQLASIKRRTKNGRHTVKYLTKLCDKTSVHPCILHTTRVSVCLLRTFILTDRVKSKEDFNLSVCCYRNQSLCQIHTHHTLRGGGGRKKQPNRKLSVSKKTRKQNQMSLALVYRVLLLSARGREATKKIRLELQRNRIEWNGFCGMHEV